MGFERTVLDSSVNAWQRLCFLFGQGFVKCTSIIHIRLLVESAFLRHNCLLPLCRLHNLHNERKIIYTNLSVGTSVWTKMYTHTLRITNFICYFYALSIYRLNFKFYITNNIILVIYTNYLF